MRRHITYANVAATLALVFAMSGGALAAKHYLIESTKQIKPSVLRTLKGARGPAGARGTAGPAGPAGPVGATGKEGPEGKEGREGKEGKEGEPATRLLAAIMSTGTVTRSQGLVSVQHTGGTNAYEVTWDRNIDACYPTANVFAEPGYVVLDGISGEKLFVETFNDEHTAAPEAFYVAVLC